MNPTDEMSDDQKEYEAMRLVNDLDKLQRYFLIPKVKYYWDSLFLPCFKESVLLWTCWKIRSKTI